MQYKHISVMSNEVIEYLNCRPGKIYVDCTLGGAGHSKKIAEKILPNGILICIDQDIDAINNARQVLSAYLSNIHIIHDNFVNLPNILNSLNIKSVDGIIMDLGLSFHQLESSKRGFSFQKDEPLDMRMDIESDTKAIDIVNNLDAKKLANLFFKYGEERFSKKIANKIVETRQKNKIETSKQLAQIISKTIPYKRAKNKIHPATRVFMALRIAVNKELERLDLFMETIFDFLNPKARLCVISFHSLEDRIVKTNIKNQEKACICPSDFPICVCNHQKKVISITKKALKPTDKEIAQNPMARSAKLRVAERL